MHHTGIKNVGPIGRTWTFEGILTRQLFSRILRYYLIERNKVSYIKIREGGRGPSPGFF